MRPTPKGPEAKAEARGYEAEARELRGRGQNFGLEALTSLAMDPSNLDKAPSSPL